jgi:hypothetical protein
VKRGKKLFGSEACSNRRNRVHEAWIGRIWPGVTSVETGSLQDRYGSSGELLKRCFKGYGRGAGGGRKVGPERYKDHGDFFPNAVSKTKPGPISARRFY